MASASGSVTHLDLLDVQKQYRARRWQDLLSSLYYKSEYSVSDDVQNGRIEGFSFDGFVVGRITSDPIAAMRTSSNIACNSVDAYMVGLVGRQPAIMIQSGRVVRVEPGQFTLLSAMEPYSVHILASSSRTSIVVPGELMRRLMPRIDERVAIPFGDQPLHQMFHAMVSEWSLSAHEMIPAARTLVANSLVDLLGLVIDGADERSAESVVRWGHRRRIERIIEDGYADPALGPVLIATRMNLSPRHIHSIIAEQGTTVGRLIRERRVAEALNLIRFDTSPHRSSSTVAQAVGYTDIRQFHRDMETIGDYRSEPSG